MSNSVPNMIATPARLEQLELSRIKERTARLFAALEEALEYESPNSFDSFSPAIDICESETCVRVSVELPGVQAEDISLMVSAKEVVIEGDKKQSVNSASKALSHYCCERSYGRFKRTLRLRWAINLNETSASLAEGTLQINLPKLQDRRGKHVKIPIEVTE